MKKAVAVLLSGALLVPMGAAPAFAVDASADNGVAFSAQSTGGRDYYSAESINLGQQVKGEFFGNYSPEQVCYYKVYAPHSGRLTVKGEADLRLSLDVRDENKDRLIYEFYSNRDGKAIINDSMNVNKGTYYLVFQRTSVEDASFRFTVTLSDTGETFKENWPGSNNIIGSANAINLGTTYKSSTGVNDTQDFFKFTLPYTGKVALDVTSPENGASYNGCWTIYDASADSIESGHVKKNDALGYRKANETYNMKKGTYYIAFGDTYKPNNPAWCDFTFRLYYPMSQCSISVPASKTYTGSALKPAPTVKIGNTKLKSGTHYTVSYSSNKAAGKAKVTIKGKGMFSGTRTAYFKVLPKKVTSKSVSAKKKGFTVKWAKAASAANVSGYQVRYSLKSSMSGATVKTVSGKAKTSYTKTSLKSKKTYYVQVRAYKTVGSTKYVGAWSKTLKVKTK